MRQLVNLCRAVFCAVLIISVLEVCARLDDVVSYDAPFWGPYDNQSLLMIDQLGKWGKPGARYEKWQLNSLGYRGPELKPGTERILCFGASETFGLYEAPNEEYPRQLERDLNEASGGATFQVVNAAFPGETLATAIQRVPEVVSQVHPSYALIYTPPVNYIESPVRLANSARFPRAVSLADRLFELRVANRVRNLLKTALPKAVQNKLRQLQIERDSAHSAVMERVPEENVDRFREDLKALIEALRERNVEPVLVTHATVFGSTLTPRDRDLLTEWRKFSPTLKEDGFMDMEMRINRVIRETAICEKLHLIDAANEIPPGPDYFADMVHFTSKGAEVMAADLTAGLQPVLFPYSYKMRLAPSTAALSDSAGCHSSQGLAASNR
jgi:lysophospholipase L1-like esterase